MEELDQIFNQWTRRYRIQRGLHWSVTGLAFGLSAGLGLSLIAFSQHLLLRNEFVYLSSGIGLLAAVLAFLAGYFWPVKRQAAARRFDRVFHLQERLSTAIEININQQPTGILEELIQKQLNDALEHARRVDVRAKLPLQLERTRLILSAVLVIAIALVAWRGEQFFQAAQAQRVVQQTIKQEIERIEELQSRIESDPQLTEEQKNEMLQPLEDAKQGLEEAQNAEQAISVLTSTQEKLDALEDAQDLSQALQEVGKALSQSEDSPLHDVGEALANGDTLAAAQALANIDAANLETQEQANLAEQLQEAAQALDEVNPELAEQLDRAAEALQQGDSQAANQALQEAAQSMNEAGQQIAQSEAAGQAAQQVGQAKDQILQAGQSASAQAAGEGQANGGQQGDGSGEGASQNGQGGSEAGSGEGTASEGGPEAGEDPIEQDNGLGDGGETAYEQIYAPTRLGGASDEQVALPESGEIGEDLLGTGGSTPGELGESSVPYVDVYAYYAEFYRQAIGSGQIPSAYSDLVRQYFLSLEP